MRRAITPFTAGMILTLAYHPFALFSVGLISFYILLSLIDTSKSAKESFIHGYFFGLGFFVTSLYWIANSLTFELYKFWWLIPLAVFAIPAALSLYAGLTCYIAHYFKSNKYILAISFSITWCILEAVREVFPLDFPWHSIAYTLTSDIYALQIASVLGKFLSSIVVMLIYTSLYPKSTNYTFIFLSLYALSIIFGAYRIEHTVLGQSDFRIRIVQPNFREHHMGRDEKKMEYFSKLYLLSKQNRAPDIKYVIWPESAVPYPLIYPITQESEKLIRILSKIGPENGYLITGIDRGDASASQWYNSMIAISAKGIEMIYDKIHLVPFGEFIPFKHAIPFIEKITYGSEDFAKGTHLNENKEIPFMPRICYEILFNAPAQISNYKYILNLTNDSWFGSTIGPYQHFAMSQFKAVELGMSVVRVATTGISASIDPLGRIHAKIELFEEGYRDLPILFIPKL